MQEGVSAAAAAQLALGSAAAAAEADADFVAEWDPTPRRGGGSSASGTLRRGGNGRRGRGRGRGVENTARTVSTARTVRTDSAAATAGEEEQRQAPDCEGLPPLPAGLAARPWALLEATHLGGDECAICLEELAAATGPLVQLRCRHTFCELCLRQQLQIAHAAAGLCPQCRGDI